MMHTNKGQIFCISDCLGLCHTYKKCANKPRSVCYADRIKIIQSNSRFIQSFLDYLIDSFYMISGGDLRYDTAVKFMDLDL